jgi:UDP-N-acetyl-2-amino-2-deoxyglucuronate dehydrogenase
MSRNLGVAIVGCGVIGQAHAATAATFDELDVVALVDAVEEASMRLSEKVEATTGHRPRTYTTLDEALADPAVDLVVVATPTGLHIQYGLAVLAANKHLIIEKPLDVDLSRAQEIEAAALAAAERGVVATVISQHRFDPSSKYVASALGAGRLGRITSAIASIGRWRPQSYYDSASWRGTWAMDGGGAVMNQGVHTIDLLIWFLGRPVEIHAHTAVLAHERMEVEDTAVATVRFESGALAVVHATTAAYPGLTDRIQLMGSRGSAVIDEDVLSYFHAASPSDEVGSMGLVGGGNQVAQLPAEELEPDDKTNYDPTTYTVGHERQYRDVLDAIQTGVEPRVRISDAVLALATVRSIYISSTLGTSVQFDDVVTGKYDDVIVSTPGLKASS